MKNPSMHVLLHEADIAVMRTVPALAEVVNRYDDGVANLSEYAEQIEEARGVTNDELEIDDNPMVSPGGDPGVWVSAWVWVEMPEPEEEDEDEGEGE